MMILKQAQRTGWSVAVFAMMAFVSQGLAESPDQMGKLTKLAGRAPQSDQAFKFVIMSDNTGGHVPGLWEQAVEQVNLLQPDFVMCVGDLIEGQSTNPAVINGMWDEMDGVLARLDAPFLFCAGNHDTSNPLMNDIFAQRHGVNGKSYYSFNYRANHFVVLNINDGMLLPSLFEEQLDWLARDLQQAADAKHVFVVYHKPLWENKEWWPKLAKLLDPARTTIFNGHWHSQRYGVYDGIETIVLSATGAPVGHGNIPEKELGNFQLVAQVSVDGPKVTTALLTLGEIQPKDIVLQSFVEAYSGLANAPLAVSVSSDYGTLTVPLTNSFPRPLKVVLSWSPGNGEVSPSRTELTIEPGQSVQPAFELKQPADGSGAVTLALDYTLTPPHGKAMFLKRSVKVNVPKALQKAIQGDAEKEP